MRRDNRDDLLVVLAEMPGAASAMLTPNVNTDRRDQLFLLFQRRKSIKEMSKSKHNGLRKKEREATSTSILVVS